MKKIFATIVIGSLLIFGAYLGISYVNCQKFKLPPEVPIYPGSVLVQEISGGTDVAPVYEYHYTSTGSPEEIVNFYTANKAQCHRTSGLKAGQVCTGDANPFGTYSVGIDFESDETESSTTYSISVLWTGCGDFD